MIPKASEKPASKPKSALAALVIGSPAPSEAKPETDHGFRAVAKAFGIPPEREAAAQAALKSYIQACTSAPDSYGDEEV